MSTFFITHPTCLEHRPIDGHPESPGRLEAILRIASHQEFSKLVRHTASKATIEDLLLAHSQKHIDDVFKIIPTAGLNFIDSDTVVSPMSGEAALYAVGAVLDAVDCVLSKKGSNAFCAIRPPGHHAHREKAAGFCLFNNIAIGALAALERKNLARVAIVDFDVHHGNGTQDIMWDNEKVLFISSQQFPLYTVTGSAEETGAHDNIMNLPVPAGSDGAVFRDLMNARIIPRLEEFKPDMIFVSAGFDAHRNDPLAELNLTEDDFADIMQDLCNVANNLCEGRLVAALEGGYNHAALAKSVAACLRVMMDSSKV